MRQYATNQKVANSIPDGVTGIFHWHNPSGRTLALGSNQPLIEMITRNISWGIIIIIYLNLVETPFYFIIFKTKFRKTWSTWKKYLNLVETPFYFIIFKTKFTKKNPGRRGHGGTLKKYLNESKHFECGKAHCILRPVRRADNLTTILGRCLEIWASQPPGTLWACPGLLWDYCTFISTSRHSRRQRSERGLHRLLRVHTKFSWFLTTPTNIYYQHPTL